MRSGMGPPQAGSPQASDTSESEHEPGRAARGRCTRNRLRVPQQGRRGPHRAVRACWRRLDLSTASAISLSLEPPYRSTIRVVNLPPDTAARCGGRTTTCRFLAEAPPLGCTGQRGSKHGLRLAEIAARRVGRVGRVHCSVSRAGLSTQMTQCGCRQRVHAFNLVGGGHASLNGGGPVRTARPGHPARARRRAIRHALCSQFPAIPLQAPNQRRCRRRPACTSCRRGSRRCGS